ncbi:MAG: hypothetical protein M0P57_12675 [Syntrophales bacterium]|jgi:Spy/CpxP family protein refolding chaperone|nr:hypothetical protein [Syntrophales bacterium]MDY0044477.1 hypothetical protein [Syntrophales bacterium]
MVKKTMIVLLMVLVGFIAVHAVNAGPWGGFGKGGGLCYQDGRGLNAVVSEKEVAMRKDLLDKRWELRTELQKESPDQKRVDELRNNILTLRERIGIERSEKGYQGPAKYGRGYGGNCPYQGYGNRLNGCWRR